MDSTPNHPRIAIKGSIFDELPAVARTDEERARIIREVVSLAMEGPLVAPPLAPMPIPSGPLAGQAPAARPGLSPLPTAEAPFQILE